MHAASKSSLAQTALEHIGALYGLEREMQEQGLSLAEVQLRCESKAKPRLQALYDWLMATRSQVPNSTATAKAIDYALKRLPTHPYSRIGELLPTHWKPVAAV